VNGKESPKVVPSKSSSAQGHWAHWSGVDPHLSGTQQAQQQQSQADQSRARPPHKLERLVFDDPGHEHAMIDYVHNEFYRRNKVFYSHD